MKYILKKVIALIITLLIVSMLSFFAFEIMKGDPARTILGTRATEAKIDALREKMGLNDPILSRYTRWLSDFLHGDMGESYAYQIPVTEMIGNKLPITVTLTLFSFFFILLFALPFAWISTKYQSTWIDKCLFMGNQVIMSIPSFFIGILFTVIFGLILKWFVPGDYISYTTDWFGFFGYMILPACAIAVPKAAMAGKILRSAMIEEQKKEYVRTAYSRGNTRNRVIIGHIFPNAVIPVITFLGWAIADILANSIIIEQVFGIPGLGRILITSISSRDYPVVEAVIVLIAIVILSINVVVDLLYQRLDKRIETI